MSSFYDDASLVMIPSCYKVSTVLCEKPTDGSGDLTFTRTGDTATRVNSSGLVEKVRTNLTLYSQDLTNAAYISGGTGSVVRTGNYAAAPDGTNTATRIQITRGATYQELYQRITGLTVGDEYTLSFYAKSLSGTPTLSTAFNNGYANEVTFTSSWVRYTYTFIVAPTGRAGLNLLTLGGGTSTTADILIWGVQLESGVATAYIPTTTAAVSVGPVANLARLDYLNSSCPRLLLEPQRTNTILWSEQINTTNWPSSTRINVTANALVSPDGYQNADVIIPNTTSGNHGPAQNVSGLTSGATYSCSIYAKAQGYSKFLILAGAGTGSGQYEFDLTAGTAQAGATITSVGNGWYRCTAPLVPNSSLLQYLIFISNGSAYSYAGNGTSGIAFWGAQVESGNFATSYIPTLSAAATRSVDDAAKTGITALIGQTEGTLFLDFEGGANDSANHFIGFSDGTTANRIVIVRSSANTLYAQIRVGGVEQALIQTGTLTENTRYKCAVAYKANDVVFYVNGAQVGTDSSATIPATSVFATNTGVGSSYFERAINQTLIFKTRLTNAQLAELTTI